MKRIFWIGLIGISIVLALVLTLTFGFHITKPTIQDLPTEPTQMVETVPVVTVAPSTEPPTEAPTEPAPPVIFSDEITFKYEYITTEDTMPYGLFTPSTAADSTSIPLIVWLHGSGEKDVFPETFLNRGLPKVLNNWTLEGFNAYVLCPHLTGRKWNPGAWYLPESKDNLQNLLDKFISEYNVDVDKIIITGHSLGGQGAMYMARQMPEHFSKSVVLSGYWPNVDINEITIPTIGYVGITSAGEDSRSVSFMHGYFAPTFGKENMISLYASHGNLPHTAFNEDKDENGRSDIIEWMLIN